MRDDRCPPTRPRWFVRGALRRAFGARAAGRMWQDGAEERRKRHEQRQRIAQINGPWCWPWRRAQ